MNEIDIAPSSFGISPLAGSGWRLLIFIHIPTHINIQSGLFIGGI
jgi:hypothetical protein